MKKKRIAGILLCIVMMIGIINFVYEIVNNNFNFSVMGIVLVSGIMGWLYLSEKE